MADNKFVTLEALKSTAARLQQEWLKSSPRQVMPALRWRKPSLTHPQRRKTSCILS